MFIYFWERGRQSRVGEGQRERETQNLKQAPGSELSAQSPTRGSNSRTMRSWPEPKSDAQPTEPPRRPKMFIYFWRRERQSMSGGGAEREGDTECEAGSRLRAVSTDPDAGLELMDCEIMTWAKVRRLTNWATQAPCVLFNVLNQNPYLHISVESWVPKAYSEEPILL